MFNRSSGGLPVRSSASNTPVRSSASTPSKNSSADSAALGAAGASGSRLVGLGGPYSTAAPCMALSVSAGPLPSPRALRPALMPLAPMMKTSVNAPRPTPSMAFLRRPSRTVSSSSVSRKSVIGFSSDGYCWTRSESLPCCPSKNAKSVTAPAVANLANSLFFDPAASNFWALPSLPSLEATDRPPTPGANMPAPN